MNFVFLSKFDVNMISEMFDVDHFGKTFSIILFIGYICKLLLSHVRPSVHPYVCMYVFVTLTLVYCWCCRF